MRNEFVAVGKYEMPLIRIQSIYVVPYANLPETKFVPFVQSIEVDNYQGTIRVIAVHANKIQWISGKEIIKTRYNIVGRFNTTFSVENLGYHSIWFKLIGDGGETCSREFALQKIQMI